MTPQAIHALLVALPAFSAEPVPETPEARSERLQGVAIAIFEASNGSRLKAGALIELGRAESRYALYVQSGNCQAGPVGARCDEGRSKGPWQQQRAACPRVWELEDGSPEQLKEGARCASRLLSAAAFRCKSRADSELAGAFSGYAGASCRAPWAIGRARRAERFAWRLR